MQKFAGFIKMLRPYKALILFALSSIVTFSSLGLLMPWMLKIIIDRALGNSDLGLLFAIIATIILIYAIREIFMYISQYTINYLAQRIMFDMRKKVFKHLQNLSLKFYQEYRTGKLISNIMSDVERVQQMILGSLVTVVVNVFIIVFVALMLFIMSPKLALICMALLPLQFFNYLYFKKRITSGYTTLYEKLSEISGNLAESIHGIKIIQSFSKGRSENRKFVASLRPTLDMTINVTMKSTMCSITTDIISVSCTLMALGFGGVMVSRGQMSVGEFVAFYTYLGMLLTPITQISGLSTVFSSGLVGIARINTLLDTIPDVKEAAHPVKMDNFKGFIEFDNVSFAYKNKMVVKDFSIGISPGQKIALVGPSGSGKSTIASLLLRFYDVSSGAIKVDGEDIRNLKLDEYRNHTGVVLQEPFLFSGTIAENIGYAKKTATREEIINAAKMANVDEFVQSLEKGYDSEIGENGVMISGGQKQRIAIARAILKNPAILILDEATSALDTVSEYLVQDALDNLMRDRTTIIIAHRLSTVKNANLIVVLKDGLISQLGTHNTLIKQDGLYRDLYLKQEEKTQKRIQLSIA